jgi:hypothetical protein
MPTYSEEPVYNTRGILVGYLTTMEKETAKNAKQFQIGDLVIGNEKADEHYCFTRTGVVCEVMDVNPFRVKVYSGDDRAWTVDPECFDYYGTVSKVEADNMRMWMNIMENQNA